MSKKKASAKPRVPKMPMGGRGDRFASAVIWSMTSHCSIVRVRKINPLSGIPSLSDQQPADGE